MEIARYITCISHLVGVSLTVNSTEMAEEGSTDKAVKKRAVELKVTEL